jgi:N-acyl homoserine lactone hydrolase
MIEVHQLHLTDVTPAPNLPWARPTFPVLAYLVMHPDGPILIDSGVGLGNSVIDELYSPAHHDLDEALRAYAVGVSDIETVITSHLHFDHCGQNNRFGHAEIFVQRAEVEAAKAKLYTVPEWAFPPEVDLTIIDGDHDVCAGIRAIATPGHTPGHQSVLIEDDHGTRTVVCCQASWTANSFGEGSLGDEGWDDATGAASVTKLRSLEPDRVLFSHDPETWRPH